MFNAMTRAEIWLQDTLDKPLGIEDLANHIGYSSSQVRRQFAKASTFHLAPIVKKGGSSARRCCLRLLLSI